MRKAAKAGRRWGFTLIEIMIVVAIVGVLSAIAIPNLLRYQLRARSTEAGVNLKAISVAEEAYWSEFGTYVSSGATVPAVMPGARSVVFPSNAGFDALGWAPEGSVYFQYRINADNGGGTGALLRYTAEAAGDLDEDGTPSYWGYVRPGINGVLGIPGQIPGSTCATDGVVARGGNGKSFLEPGPCDAASGFTRF